MAYIRGKMITTLNHKTHHILLPSDEGRAGRGVMNKALIINTTSPQSPPQLRRGS